MKNTRGKKEEVYIDIKGILGFDETILICNEYRFMQYNKKKDTGFPVSCVIRASDGMVKLLLDDTAVKVGTFPNFFSNRSTIDRINEACIDNEWKPLSEYPVEKPYKAVEIARYIVNRSRSAGHPATLLKLFPLMYLIQGIYLVEHNEPLFHDKFETWSVGPVLPSVYQEFKEFGNNDIPCVDPEYQIAEEDEMRINHYIDMLCPYSSHQLSKLIKDEDSPFIKKSRYGKLELNDIEIKNHIINNFREKEGGVHGKID